MDILECIQEKLILAGHHASGTGNCGAGRIPLDR
jgi:hypothetical protein